METFRPPARGSSLLSRISRLQNPGERWESSIVTIRGKETRDSTKEHAVKDLGSAHTW